MSTVTKEENNKNGTDRTLEMNFLLWKFQLSRLEFVGGALQFLATIKIHQTSNIADRFFTLDCTEY